MYAMQGTGWKIKREERQNMKRIVQGSVFMFLGVLLVLIILTNIGRGSRESETRTALAEAIDTTMSSMFENHTYASSGDRDKFVADFLEALMLQMGSDSEVEVSVLNADPKKGILSVEVTEHYTHPNGNTGSVSEVRTVLFEKEEEEEPVRHQVEFYLSDGVLYKKYELLEGEVCSIPVAPKQEGKSFTGWQFITGGSGNAGGINVVYADGNGTKNVLASGGLPYMIGEDTKLIAVFQ